MLRTGGLLILRRYADRLRGFGGGIFRRENFSDGIKHIFVFFPKVVSDLPTAHNYLVVYDFNNSIHGLSSIGKRKAPALFGVEAVG